MGSTHSIPAVAIGCITFSCIIFAPMVISIYRKIRKGSTIQENFSEFPFPYLASFMNFGMGLIYRLPKVHPHPPNSTVLLILNGVGILFEGIYIFFAFKSSTGLKRVIAWVFVITVVLIFTFWAWIYFGVDTTDRRFKIVGPMCVFSTILTYGSTIPALIRALTITKKVDNVSWFLTGTGFANTIIWLLYGSIKNDKYMKIQNGCGLVLCFIQFTFYGKINAAATDLPVSNPVAAELPHEGEL